MLKATCYYSRAFNDIAAPQCPEPVRVRDGKLVCLIQLICDDCFKCSVVAVQKEESDA